MRFSLLILDGPQMGRRLPVEAAPAIIGRNPAADLPFPYDNFISGRHVSVQADGRGVLLNDLRSTNGTFVNGERVTQAVAAVGDVVKIGSMNVRVEAVEQPAAPAPPPSAAWGSALPPEPFAAPPAPAPYTQQAPTPPPAYSLPPMEIPAPPPPFGAAHGVPAQDATVPFVPQHPPSPPLFIEPPPAAPAHPSFDNPAIGDSGATRVLSSLDFAAPPPPPAVLPPAPLHSAKVVADTRKKNEAVRNVLRDSLWPLFCLLNAGADETIPAMLALADVDLAEHCLLEPGTGAPPPRWAPYLLPLAPDSPLLRLLVEKGWGKGWGNFFTSFGTFDELRTHFRKFLMVQVANGGEPYFRFWEPEVLRGFLIAGSPTELSMFFGPIDEWMLESEDKAAMLKARTGADGLETTTLPLVEGA